MRSGEIEIVGELSNCGGNQTTGRALTQSDCDERAKSLRYRHGCASSLFDESFSLGAYYTSCRDVHYLQWGAISQDPHCCSHGTYT